MESKVVATKREGSGTARARRLRKAGQLPANLNTTGGAAVSIQMNRHDFVQMLHHHTSENVILDLDLEGQGALKALLTEVQHHPVTGDVLHADLIEISMTEKITVEIPLELVGDAPGVEMGGTVDHVLRELEVECLPADLVEQIEVDISGMRIGDTLTVGDLTVDPKLEVLTDAEIAVVSIAAPRLEEEPTAAEAVAAGAEPEVIGAKDADEESKD